jgi:hypothetical protein
MKLRLISLLLVSVRVSAHLGHSHHESHAIRVGPAVVPIKTNHSTIDWTQDDQPFRLGDLQFPSLKEFKDKHARCGTRDPPESARIASQEQVEAYLTAHPEATGTSTTAPFVNISVYFHCIKSGSAGACSSSVVNRQIAVLNAAFSPTFSFHLESALAYSRPEYYNCDVQNTTQERRMKEEFHQGDMITLNMYSCNTTNNALGWATFPDGSGGGGGQDL